MVCSIFLVQFTCLTVLFHNLSPGLLWSSSWSGTIYFVLHAFLHPVIIFFSLKFECEGKRTSIFVLDVGFIMYFAQQQEVTLVSPLTTAEIAVIN